MAAPAGTALVYNWTISQSELVKLQVPVTDGSGQAFDVTGWSVDAKIKDAPGGTVLYTWSNINIVVSGTTVTLIVPWTDSSTWTFTGGWYRVKIIHPTDSSQVYRILQGIVQVQPD